MSANEHKTLTLLLMGLQEGKAQIRKNILLIKLKQMTTEEKGLSHVTSVPRMIRLNMQNVK